ncbi:MAG: hypothetical protein A3F41_06560 [Coxiella sp. RIFCSPHIGHO2_12_FULL_44_14]|nr:MAG: hypothetical protein A3F41_06560 [Coxiella sp. RIFCSPHIGHO2_12_FULL_44_14]
MDQWREIVFVSLLCVMTLVAVLYVIFPLIKKRGYHSKPAYRMAIVVACGFSVLTAGLYAHWGAHAAWRQYWVLKKEGEQTQKILSTLKSPEQVVDRLTAHLKQFPESAQGWYLLGRLQFHLGHYPQSLTALTKAHDLDGDRVEYTTALAHVLFFTQHRLSPQWVRVLQNVLQRAPNDITVIHLLALNAYHSRQYLQAIHYWEQLISLLPPEGLDHQRVLSMIAHAERQLQRR